MPQTIVSRSQVLNFRPVKTDTIYNYLIKEHGVNRSQAKNLSRLALGRPPLAIKFLEDKEFYQNYLAAVNFFLTILENQIPDRFKLIAKWIMAHKGESDLSLLAGDLISVWEAVGRDLLLISSGSQNLLQHEVAKDALLKVKNNYEAGDWLRVLKLLKLSRNYLSANVNYKNVLENIAINI